MPTLTATVTTTTEIKLKPSIRTKLLNLFRQYAALRDQKKTTEHAMKKIVGQIADIRNETGEGSLKLEGFTTSLVAPTRKKFNEKRFVAEGGDLELYKSCFDEVPVKSYEKVSVPGEKEDDNEA